MVQGLAMEKVKIQVMGKALAMVRLQQATEKAKVQVMDKALMWAHLGVVTVRDPPWVPDMAIVLYRAWWGTAKVQVIVSARVVGRQQPSLLVMVKVHRKL